MVDAPGAGPEWLRAARGGVAGPSAGELEDQVDAVPASLREDFHGRRPG